VFFGDNVTLYYLAGTVGWASTFLGLPTAVWTLPYPQPIKAYASGKTGRRWSC
jgi:hypothetical protein